MPHEVTMPQLGEGVEEGTIGKWLKAVGDPVRVGDPLVEVVLVSFLLDVLALPAQVLHAVAPKVSEIIMNSGSVAPSPNARMTMGMPSSTVLP